MIDEKDERFNRSIDNKNRQLLQMMEEEGIQIEFEIRPEKECWAVRPKPKYVIAAPNDEADPASLAHELLHIMLDSLGYVPSHIIARLFIKKNCRFDPSHLHEWENLLAHCKMIRHFKSLGYEGMKFTSHGENQFYTGEILQSFELVVGRINFLKSNRAVISPELISFFLGLLISTKEYELQYSDYNNKLIGPQLYYDKLRNCDTTLFEVLIGELNSWISEERNYSNVDFIVELIWC